MTKGYDDSDVTVPEGVENCEFPALTLSQLAVNVIDVDAKACLTKGTKCPVNTEEGTKFTIRVNDEQTEDFYVLADDGNKVTLIMNKNLGNTVAWYEDSSDNSYGPITALTYLQSQTNDWTNLAPIVINKFDYDEREDAQLPNNQSFTMYARLPKYSEIHAINNSAILSNTPWLYINLHGTGDNTADSNGNYKSGYWTSAANSGDPRHARFVDFDGLLYSHTVNYDNRHGVRPVIELSK